MQSDTLIWNYCVSFTGKKYNSIENIYITNVVTQNLQK